MLNATSSLGEEINPSPCLSTLPPSAAGGTTNGGPSSSPKTNFEPATRSGGEGTQGIGLSRITSSQG